MVRQLAFGTLIAAVLAPFGRASLYQPDDPALTLPIRPDGMAEALPFDEFRRRWLVYKNVGNPQLRSADRQLVKDRAVARMNQRDLSPDETIALAVDLLRLGIADEAPMGGGVAPHSSPPPHGSLDADEALNRLLRLKREQGARPHYYVYATLAHLYAARGNWSDAVSHLESAVYDVGEPPPVKGLTPAQQAWQVRLDREYVLPLFRFRQHEAAQKPRPAAAEENVDPLFPPREKNKPFDPVRFVNDAGRYEPGTIAAREKAKLPADAVAVVQQMLLWFPNDTRLLWLLGEVYAAEGKLNEAEWVLDNCVSQAGQYGNRKLLVEHRAAVRAAVDAKRQAEEQAEADNYPLSWRTIAVYFAIVGVVVVFAAARSIRRKRTIRRFHR